MYRSTTKAPWSHTGKWVLLAINFSYRDKCVFTWQKYTIFARWDTVATIYFIMQFCMVSNREQLLFENGVYILNLGQKMKKSTASRKLRRWSGFRCQGVNLKRHCHPFADFENELEESELVLEDCESSILCFLQSLNCNYYSYTLCFLWFCHRVTKFRFVHVHTCYSNISHG